jgi:hypothetical protein
MNRKQKQTKSMMPPSSNIVFNNAKEVREPLLLNHQAELFDVPVVADDQAAVVVVFSSPACCGPWKLFALFLLCLISFLRILYLDLTYHGDALTRQTLDRIVWYGAGLRAILLLVIMVFRPRHYQVLSDLSIVVQTTLTSFKFGNIQGAHRNSGLCETFQMRWDFALEFSNRVFVERAGNRWQVSCSPHDPDGFVAAIRHVCSSTVPTTLDETMTTRV